MCLCMVHVCGVKGGVLVCRPRRDACLWWTSLSSKFADGTAHYCTIPLTVPDTGRHDCACSEFTSLPEHGKLTQAAHFDLVFILDYTDFFFNSLWHIAYNCSPRAGLREAADIALTRNRNIHERLINVSY